MSLLEVALRQLLLLVLEREKIRQKKLATKLLLKRQLLMVPW